MEQFDYDLAVIGAGSAGVRLARTAAQMGAKVVVIENRYLGGTCVNVGCVPKKLFVYAAQFNEEFVAAEGYGWQVQRQGFTWSTLRDNKTREIERLNGVYASLLDNTGVTVISGTATIVGPHRVRVGEDIIRCERIAIATGGWPNKGTYPGADLVVDSNEVFDLESLPESVLVEGGGYIAVEFAGIFNGLGCQTELVYRGPLFLRNFDQDISLFLAAEMRQKGVKLRFDARIERLDKMADGKICVTFDDSSTQVVDMVFSAIGRRPLLDGLGLENTQVQTNEDGTVAVDANFQTHEPSIFALGDVVGRMPLTPVALAEAMALARYLFQNAPVALNYDGVPTAVFSQPEIATVGLSEEQARAKYPAVEVFSSQFRPLKHTLSGAPEKTLMKMIVDKATQKVLGCHMIGTNAAEIMQGMAVAINMGATKQDFDRTVGIHPSAAEEFVTMR